MTSGFSDAIKYGKDTSPERPRSKDDEDDIGSDEINAEEECELENVIRSLEFSSVSRNCILGEDVTKSFLNGLILSPNTTRNNTRQEWTPQQPSSFKTDRLSMENHHIHPEEVFQMDSF